MKKFLYVFLFALILDAKAQTSVYHPFPDSGAIWNVSYYGAWTLYHESCSYVMNGDTFIGSNTWHKLFIPYIQRSGDTVSYTPRHIAGYAGCIRQDVPGKKVFYLAPGDTSGTLIYNFNLQVGDSAPEVPICNEPALIVSSIDSVLVGTDYRKAWRFAPFPLTFNNPSYIVEGIGRASGLLEACQFGIAADGPGYTLTCFKQNGVTLYPDSSVDCNIIISVNDFSEGHNSLILFPNPATNEFKIHNSKFKIEGIEIYDVLGAKCLAMNLFVPSKELTFDVSSLSNGIYFISIKTQKENVVKKFVKQ